MWKVVQYFSHKAWWEFFVIQVLNHAQRFIKDISYILFSFCSSPPLICFCLLSFFSIGRLSFERALITNKWDINFLVSTAIITNLELREGNDKYSYWVMFWFTALISFLLALIILANTSYINIVRLELFSNWLRYSDIMFHMETRMWNSRIT